ncbi:MAG TPA: HlyD family secretion protein [Stellaceae bacterium]|nr:HlyD family secretion protein [Stellaceae bacterium]
MSSSTETLRPAPSRPRPGAVPDEAGRTRRRWPRLILMFVVPLVVVIGGGFWYLSTGRYVSTDDAYGQADVLTASANIAGRVVAVGVRDNEYVKKGTMLFRIDDATYLANRDKAEAALKAARLQVDTMRATYRQRLSELQSAQDTLNYAQREYNREGSLLSSHTVSQAQFDQARHALDVAKAQVSGANQQIAAALAGLGGDPNIPTNQHPMVEQAQAALDLADIDVDNTVIRAPESGTVTQVNKLPLGTYLTPAMPTFALVGTDDVWVEANFKETDLNHMHVGQAATVDVDAYPDVTFKAHVQSLSPGTGSEFSVLPAQNATGNWVKVVQRLPVKLVLDNPDPQRPLRAGMSVNVEVDTGYESPLWARIKSVLGLG